MSLCDLPYFCPRCGNDQRFSNVPALRSHLVSRHTYETLLVLSHARARSSSPGTLVPLLAHAAARPDHPVLGLEQDGRPSQLACLDLACSSASAQLLRDMLISRDRGGVATSLEGGATTQEGGATSSTGHPHISMALALPGSLGPACEWSSLAELELRGLGAEVGLGDRLGLGLERRIARTVAEVEERVAQRVDHLRKELQRREVEIENKRLEAERLGREKADLEEQASHLSWQVAVSVEMMATLRKDLQGKEQELALKRQEVCELERFLTVTAEREAEAKRRLQAFIEALLQRADWAESQLQLLVSSGRHTHNHVRHNNNNKEHTQNSDRHAQNCNRHSHNRTNGHGANREGYSGSDDDVNTVSKLIGHRRSYSVSSPYRQRDQIYQPHCGAPTGRMRTLSLGSGGWHSDAVGEWGTPQEAHRLPQHHHDPCHTREGHERRGYSRTPEGRGAWEHQSTEEEEEGDDEDTWSEDTPDTPLRQAHNRPEHTPGSGVSSPCLHSDIALGAETLRTRAGLFCIFPYLDVRTLLLAAEVCSDWRFVARHPAVWTRVRLENARVSVKFLVTMSQWCTQTQSLVLQNLKPRSQHPDECREAYHQTTRGCLEAGVEALLRSAGGSLLILQVSHCPHVLTDRSLWLASCYSRNLLHLTYRSSSDPMGHEVLWALGAGCRNISSLQVAPLHPCLQPTRFSNRCLQMIGRCWPHLRVLSVGGAGCGIQGLATLARNCVGLQVLELERFSEIGQEGAAELCREGLQNLETLLLTSTSVTPKALLHFNSMCRKLRSIVVHAGKVDYSDEPDSPEAKRLYNDMVNKLQTLKNPTDKAVE
ncbi:hypothetical protein UPYG_G00243620 [Umbra pygmaea]|uniref:F-box domain-containing protein n=1 Tax=Umbra pygmaea TaxID=75934 RepID=A0ABD0WKV2_UMBPY